jgi:hypothetical protein
MSSSGRAGSKDYKKKGCLLTRTRIDPARAMAASLNFSNSLYSLNSSGNHPCVCADKPSQSINEVAPPCR